ncbi:hypothetical protein AVEN_182170-1 [Araneus ventricosus]|uniref:Uncharacterized protein n=1 Tax=Araneus ventricosus TaxID=182803 RepID=A0A4Y2PNL0_ARAVE|nr:hypothetical protein AVEN_182170-1 [Araneus ventricosus]
MHQAVDSFIHPFKIMQDFPERISNNKLQLPMGPILHGTHTPQTRWVLLFTFQSRAELPPNREIKKGQLKRNSLSFDKSGFRVTEKVINREEQKGTK